MSHQELTRLVLDPDLCTGCGACALVCPESIVGFDMDRIVPVFTAPAATCGTCSACSDVCPGLDPGTPQHEIRLFGRVREAHERWIGIYQNVYGGAATDEATFNASASGGSATTMLQAAMHYFDAGVALVMGRDEEKPWRSAPVLVREREQLRNNAQSTYQLAPYLGKLREVYLNEPDTRIVMSGIACQVQAIRKLQALPIPMGEWARTHIVFIVEIGCSSNTLPLGTESLIVDVAKVPLNQVSRLKYREGEYPGQIAITDQLREVTFVPFWQAVRHFKDNKTNRCLSCGDWVSGLADVTVSDGDPNIFAGSLGENKVAKHGRIFVRTARGAQTLRYADLMNMLDIWPVDLQGLNLGLERKRNRRASYEQSGKPIPLGPIPGHLEQVEIRADTDFLAVPERILNEDQEGGSLQ